MPSAKFNRRRWGLGLLLVVALAGALVWLADGPEPEFLERPPQARQARFGFLGRWKAPLRSTWQKLKFRFLGQPRSVMIESEIFRCGPWLIVPHLPDSPPLLQDQAGNQVWLMDTNLKARLKQPSRPMTRPQVVALAGQPAQIFVGGPGAPFGSFTHTESRRRPPEYTVDYLAEPRKQGVQLSWFMTGREFAVNTNLLAATNSPWLMRTNFSSGVRLLVPSGQSVLIVNTNQPGERGCIGAILSLKVL